VGTLNHHVGDHHPNQGVTTIAIRVPITRPVMMAETMGDVRGRTGHPEPTSISAVRAVAFGKMLTLWT
jgi:hypothetical protein